jgi:hypothetical protein
MEAREGLRSPEHPMCYRFLSFARIAACSAEEELIQRYFDAFNSHDVEGVMACFHENPVVERAGG